jgi:hypothetical protein
MSKINFLALTLANIDIPEGQRKPCENCGDPECNSVDLVVNAKLFDESERELAMALLDGDQDLSSPVPPVNASGDAIGRHYRGGKTAVFEIHHTDRPRAALQGFALDQASGLGRVVVWQTPRVEGDLDPVAFGLEGILCYEAEPAAIAA